MTLPFTHFLDASGGRFIADAQALPSDFRPSTDSRTIERGEVFVCLRGPNFDGHDYIAAALARGAAAIVVDDDAKAARQPGVPIVRVADTKRAYLEAAALVRRMFHGQVIGVTGSNGKTTTKDMTAQIIGKHATVLSTPNNENNELGVAKACYQLNATIDVAVIEMGARHPGEIEELVKLAAPTIGVLTNIAEAHLEFFHDQAELAATKFAIFSAGARPVCNAGDSWSRMSAAQAGMDAALWVRLVGDPHMSGIMLEAGLAREGRVAITFGASHAFATWHLLGDYNLRNALLGTGAAILAGLDFEEAIAALGDLHLPPGRFEMHRTSSGVDIVYDAYNASPTSVMHALRAFADLPAKRHIAVLGSMAELGTAAGAHHEAVGAAAARGGIDLLYCGGQFADALQTGACGAGMTLSSVMIFTSNAEIAERLSQTLGAGDCVLLKGSRIQKMEEILAGLLASGTLAL